MPELAFNFLRTASSAVTKVLIIAGIAPAHP
jgi:hypothetical protein